MSDHRSCEEYGEWLTLEVGGDLEPQRRSELEGHLGNCAGCRQLREELAASQSWWLEGVAGEPELESDSGLRAAVWAQIERDGRASRTSRNWLVAAGLLALVAVSWLGWRMRAPISVSAPIAEQRTLPETSTPSSRPPAPGPREPGPNEPGPREHGPADPGPRVVEAVERAVETAVERAVEPEAAQQEVVEAIRSPASLPGAGRPNEAATPIPEVVQLAEGSPEPTLPLLVQWQDEENDLVFYWLSE